MTEQEIEELVEVKIDYLDAYFMRGDIDEEEYNIRMQEIKDWADEQYARIA
jgi:uncharacterized membrane protein